MARTKFQPKETEYNGVVFRSKSEALLSRLLHLYGIKHMYEPGCIVQTDWTPDFLIPEFSSHSMTFRLIEYKPAIPTQTYLKWIDECADKVWRHWLASMIDTDIAVICFNWYEPSQCDTYLKWDFYERQFQDIGKASQILGITPELRKEILKTRFDLMESSNYGG